MDYGSFPIFLGAGLVVLSILSILLSQRFGVPVLLLFIAIGMLAGEDGPGGILYSNFPLTYILGSIALSIILFDGGLNTSKPALKLALAPASLLATVGVMLTAVITAFGAHVFLGVDMRMSLLLGAIVASTDAAAVFFLLRQKGIKLPHRLKATLEMESGMNDPAAVLLVATFSQLILDGEHVAPVMEILNIFVELAVGAGLGAAGGFILVFIINRTNLTSGLYPVLAISGALLVFGLAQLIGASGFIAVYIMGITVNLLRHRARRHISNFSNGMAWVGQIMMFLLLGLLATPSAMLPYLWTALPVAAVLMFVARPVGVALCLAPFRYNVKEITFISWVGLRGAVPIYLATVPVLLGVKNSLPLFTLVFVVVLLSLGLQGWTIGFVARRLGLTEKH